jgi:hypothetical protein
VVREKLLEDFDAAWNWYIWKPDQTGMGNSLQVNEGAEICVDGDENPFFSERPFKKCLVTGIGFRTGDIDDVMSLLA